MGAELDSLKVLLLEIAQQRSLKDLLWLIVRRLGDQPAVALARIWLIQPGDRCGSCRMREECPNQTRCLHLVASAGKPASESDKEWTNLNGDFCRIPLGVRKVGHIGATGEPIILPQIEDGTKWIARPEWVK